MTTLIALLGASAILLVALTGCVVEPVYSPPQVHGRGYLPAYPSYEHGREQWR